MGPEANKDKSAQATLEAESTEALIGALYEYLQELEPIHKWLKPYWEEQSFTVLADPYKKNCKSALQEWSQKEELGLPIYTCCEESKIHGDPKKFFCEVHIEKRKIGQGWGSSRKEAEKQAAEKALNAISNSLI